MTQKVIAFIALITCTRILALHGEEISVKIEKNDEKQENSYTKKMSWAEIKRIVAERNANAVKDANDAAHTTKLLAALGYHDLAKRAAILGMRGDCWSMHANMLLQAIYEIRAEEDDKEINLPTKNERSLVSWRKIEEEAARFVVNSVRNSTEAYPAARLLHDCGYGELAKQAAVCRAENAHECCAHLNALLELVHELSCQEDLNIDTREGRERQDDVLYDSSQASDGSR